MIHICADEVGMIAAAVAFIGTAITPVRNCVKCYAILAYNKVRGK